LDHETGSAKAKEENLIARFCLLAVSGSGSGCPGEFRVGRDDHGIERLSPVGKNRKSAAPADSCGRGKPKVRGRWVVSLQGMGTLFGGPIRDGGIEKNWEDDVRCSTRSRALRKPSPCSFGKNSSKR